MDDFIAEEIKKHTAVVVTFEKKHTAVCVTFKEGQCLRPRYCKGVI